MLRSIVVIVIICLSCKREENISVKNNYTLYISVPNIENNTKILLKKQEGYLSMAIDSTLIKNQKAIFEGTINLPEVYGVFIEGYKEGIFPIIEKGTINVKVKINDLANSEIAGTKLNEQLAQYKENSREISSKMNDLFHEFQRARAENNSQKLIEINEQMRVIDKQRNDFSKKFIKNNSNSFVASMVLHSMSINKDISRDTIEKLYALLSNQVKKSEFSKSVALELEIDTLRKDKLQKFP
ncbi:MAG: DUF4369 domain-containing protein [Flavobacteriaceae bacterium]|nr:DUF4369 domain-containing protein [Flavobacteriaceae bacterium]